MPLVDQSKVTELQGNDQETFVVVVFKVGVSGILLLVREEEQSFKRNERSPSRRAGGDSRVGQEKRCRAPLHKTPLAESPQESASV